MVPKIMGREVWHVVWRGVRRLTIYHIRKDRIRFLEILPDALRRSNCILAAHAQIGNHVHMLLAGHEADISQCMQILGQAYALYHNRGRGLKGHCFESRFFRRRQVTLWQLLWTWAYILANPVCAGYVKDPRESDRSSCRSFVGGPGDPFPVNPLPLLQTLGGNAEDHRAKILDFLRRQCARGVRPSKSAHSWTDTCTEEFRDLLDAVRGVGGLNGRLSAEDIAVFKGDAAGIPPRAMAPVLGDEGTGRIRARLCRLKKRVALAPDLDHFLKDFPL